ncbi:MAG: hypothetical protein ACRC2T_02825 [Thermoguttaceae bacterium]
MPTTLKRKELDTFIYPSRNLESDQRTLRSNPLDELDCVNHYCFAGQKNFCANFLALSINDHSPGDETLFLAAQLVGTQSRIVHFDYSPLSVELAKARATKIGVADRILWCTGELEAVHELFVDPRNSDNSSNSDKHSHTRPLGNNQFDYVRCCGALNWKDDFESELDKILAFMKPDGALGMSCFGFYGREPYRQFQTIANILGSDSPGVQEEVDRLKELYVFAPDHNFTRLAFENLVSDVRSMKDDAFAAHFLREDGCALTVPQIYEILDRKNLKLANFARHTRIMYQPWFAQKNPELLDLLKQLPIQDTQAVAEIVWNTIEEHIFWAIRPNASRIDPNNWDNIVFFNPMSQNQNHWREKFLSTEADTTPQLIVKISPEEKYNVVLPWNPQIKRMIELINGYRSFKEIIITIREEQSNVGGNLTTEEILCSCGQFLLATELEDIILMRAPGVPVLPFTARTF